MLNFIGRAIGTVIALLLMAIGLRTVALQIFIWKEGHDHTLRGTDIAV